MRRLIIALSSLCLVIFICIITSISCASQENLDNMNFFKEVLKQVKKEYIEELSDKKLIEYALGGMLSSLDPHSMYLGKDSYNEMLVITRGEFGGIGVEFALENNVIRVISPYEDSPAFKSGIKAGDYIIMVNGESIKNMPLASIVDKLRGAPGSKINLKIYRENVGSFEVTVVREVISIIPVKAKLISENTVLHIKISAFNEKTASLIKKEFNSLIKNHPNAQGLILDLRWNPGGLLEQAKEVADLFLRQGDIVTIKGRDPALHQIYRAEPDDITYDMPIVVLINGGSASAAEIVAGALQDNKRALVVGTKSFGKGSVQKVIPLKDGTAIKLTTALYYTPSGGSIQAEGITPDIIVPEAIVKLLEKSSNIVGSESELNGHLGKVKNNSNSSSNTVTKKSVEASLNLEETEDFQLLRAIDVIKIMALNKIVFTCSVKKSNETTH